VNRPSGGSFALRLVDPLSRVEAVPASFTAVGLDVCRKQNVIRDTRPGAADSGGLALGALGDLKSASRGDCNRGQPPKHGYKNQAQLDITNPHAISPSV
jgi:hypothetical protein